jgi:hypothetical protein
MLVTLGGRFSGYGPYLLNGKPIFLDNFLDLQRYRWEGQQALTPGRHTIVLDFKYDGPGFGKGGSGVLKVDDRAVAYKQIPRTVPSIMTIDETFDVGVDTRTPVDDTDYQVPLRLHRKALKAEIRQQLSSEDRQTVGSGRATAHDER